MQNNDWVSVSEKPKHTEIMTKHVTGYTVRLH